MDGVQPGPKLTTLRGLFSFSKPILLFWGLWALEKQDFPLIKRNGYFYEYWEELICSQIKEWSVFFCRKPVHIQVLVY